MEYKTKIAEEGYEHIIPLFSALDSSRDGSVVLSSCEKVCVCVCVCRHGKASSMDFSKKDSLEKETETLFERALAA